MVSDWDGTMGRDRPEPLIFTAWLREAVRLIFADELGDSFPLWWGPRPLSVKAVLTGAPRWCDDATTPAAEDCAERLSAALDSAVAALAGSQGDDPRRWRWGALHRARFDHPVLGRIPLIGFLFDAAIPADGGADTVNRGLTNPGSPDRPFASVHGAGYRAVYDLADPDASRFIATPGQSGNFLSSHYTDMMRLWRDGGSLAIGRDAGPDARRLILQPAAER
jgi:penicillin amidase